MRRGPASVVAVMCVALTIAGCSAPGPTDAAVARWQTWSDHAMSSRSGDLFVMGGSPSIVSKDDQGIIGTSPTPRQVDTVVLSCTGPERMMFDIRTAGRKVVAINSIDVRCDNAAKTVDLHGVDVDRVLVDAVQADGLGRWAAHVRRR